MEKVNALLGYTYCIEGKIVHGHQVGRTIGVPTINQIPDIDKLVPPRGVYATRTRIDGQEFKDYQYRSETYGAGEVCWCGDVSF